MLPALYASRYNNAIFGECSSTLKTLGAWSAVPHLKYIWQLPKILYSSSKLLSEIISSHEIKIIQSIYRDRECVCVFAFSYKKFPLKLQ